MKTIIATAAALILSTGVAQAQSFDFEKSVGSAELFSTLATEGTVSVSGGSEFAYQVQNDSTDLYPTLGIANDNPQVSGERTAFEYQINVGNELDPHLS